MKAREIIARGGGGVMTLLIFLQEVSRSDNVKLLRHHYFKVPLQYASTVRELPNEMAETMLSEIALRLGAWEFPLSSGRDGIDPER